MWSYYGILIYRYCKKKRPKRRLCFGRGSKIGYAATALIRKAHRHTCVCLSLVVEPLFREFSSTAPNAIKKTAQKAALFLAGAVRFELTTLGFGDRCSTN